MRIRNFTKIGGRSALLQISPPPRGNIRFCNERGRSAMLQTFPFGGRSAMLQIFRGKVCNVADLPGGRSARGKVCNTTPQHFSILSRVFDLLWAVIPDVASRAGDVDYSCAPGLTSGCQR